MGLLNWILSIFGFSNDEQKALPTPTTSSEVQEEIHVKKDRTNEIVSESQDYIKRLYELSILVKDTVYYDKVLQVKETTQKIHDKILQEEKVPNERLEQFHMYYTSNFLETYTEAFHELVPKKEVEAKFKSSYKLNQEIEKAKKKKEELDIINNINSLTNSERVDILLKSIDSSYRLIQCEGFYDIIEKESYKGKKITYADKYNEYLINNWKLPKESEFIGELNHKETPIVYNLNTLDVFKILLDSNNPVKIGNIGDEYIKKILTKK